MGQLKCDCGPHRPRSCHSFFVGVCVLNMLSKCQALGAQVYLWTPRPRTLPFPQLTPTVLTSFLPPLGLIQQQQQQ